MTTTSLLPEKHDQHDLLHNPGQHNLHLHQQPLVHMEPHEQLRQLALQLVKLCGGYN